MFKIVRCNQGVLRGSVERLPTGGQFLSFKGIPYAKPPIGKLRFKAPELPDRWRGIRDATKFGHICPQIDAVSGDFVDGNEDCLFLNVFVPINGDKKQAVMVYFHGGAFMSGSGNSDLHGPEFILSENVIVVTVNYRLEVLGFLSLENADIPGNAGLKDQVAAMRWVKENIENFGGNSNNITIFGESVGASCATYHLFSPLCKGLFNRVIAHSGVCINEWAISPSPRERAIKLAKYLGNDSTDLTELGKFFRGLPTRSLVKVTWAVMTQEEKRRGLPLYFCPVIESQCPDQESYLTEPVMKMIKEGRFTKVPIIIGYNNKEALTSMKYSLKKVDEVNKDFERFVPHELSALLSHKKCVALGEAMRKFYFDNQQFSESNVQTMVDLQTDCCIIYNVYRFARLLFEKTDQPVYFFTFSCDSKLNLMKAFMGFENQSGACHADDIFYIFKTKFTDEKLDPTTETGRIMLQCIRLWTNFAKFGNPTENLDDVITVNWKPITDGEKMDYIDIGNELKVDLNPNKERFKFWENIFRDAYSDVKNHRSRL